MNDTFAYLERLARGKANEAEHAFNRWKQEMERATAMWVAVDARYDNYQRLKEEAEGLAAVIGLSDRVALLEDENAKLNRWIVAHHELTTLSDKTITEAYGPGGTGACPICRSAHDTDGVT